MALELKVPPAGESITEVQIGQWLKKEGDSVRRDEILVVIETDKVTVELPAPASGKLTKILIQSGTDAAVGDVIGYLEEGAVDASGPAPKANVEPKAEEPKAAPPKANSAPIPPPPEAFESEEESSPDVRKSLPPQGFARVMPSARRAMAEQDVSASEVTPTGPGGRVLKEDVERAVQAKAAPKSAPKPAPKVEARPVLPADERGEEIVPMSPMRRKIAERLVESQQTMALLTTFNEVDMSAVMNLRKQYQDQFVKKYGMKLGFMSFFVKAVVEALKEFPAVNGEIRERSIVYKNYYDIGVAVGGGKGLVVPVIRNADRLGFAQIEQTISDFGQRAQKNQIKLEELTGGTFTISNGGVYGSMLSTPIVNPPQSGVLGMHNIVERPWAVDGKVEIRPIMYTALTYDHRIVDGREAVSFLKRIKETIESPARILLEV
jgi:2-oxoglutarate dehydrogenase E2 component (dihydrolipoamide succinyltransferase)